MRYPISKLIWAGLIIALIFLGAMFILPVVGAVLIGVFALSCLIWLSSKVFGFFQGGRTYTEDNPGDYYDASARTSIVPKKWNKTQAVDAEVIEVEEIKKEVMDLHTTIYDKYGYEMKYIRPPKGEYSERTVAYTKSLGYITTMWSFAYMDWDENKQGREDYAKKMILDNLHNGEVILLHGNSKDNANILDYIIKEIKSQGYEFKSLDEYKK